MDIVQEMKLLVVEIAKATKEAKNIVRNEYPGRSFVKLRADSEKAIDRVSDAGLAAMLLHFTCDNLTCAISQGKETLNNIQAVLQREQTYNKSLAKTYEKSS